MEEINNNIIQTGEDVPSEHSDTARKKKRDKDQKLPFDLQEIIFYGQDHTSIDKAVVRIRYTIGKDEVKKKGKKQGFGKREYLTKPYSLNRKPEFEGEKELQNAFRRLLWNTLLDMNSSMRSEKAEDKEDNEKSESKVIIGFSSLDDEKDNNRKTHGFSFTMGKFLEREISLTDGDAVRLTKDTKEVSAEESEKDEDEKKNVPRFGNLVGVIRREFQLNREQIPEEWPEKKEDSMARDWWNIVRSDDVETDQLDDVGGNVSKLIWRRNNRGNKPFKMISIEIYSRFDSIDMDKPEPFFLAALLLRGRVQYSKNYDIRYDYDAVFDFLMICILQEQLREAFRKGFFKKYQRFQSNSEKLRGAIDIPRHIRMNLGMNNGKVACTYRENTTDNMVNHLILTAFDHLKKKYPILVEQAFDNDLIREMQSLKYEIGYPKYSTRAVITGNLTAVSHPFFTEYRELQKYCLMILRDEALSPFGGDRENVKGILYYVPDLWEDYLEYHFKKCVKGLDEPIKVRAQSRKDIMTCGKYGEQKGKEAYFKMSTARPDFVFSYSEEGSSTDIPFLIMDAKYKMIWGEALLKKSPVVDNHWAYSEDYNKCLRDQLTFDAVSSGVVIPMAEPEDGEGENAKTSVQEKVWVRKWDCSDLYNRGSFYTLPVKIPRKKGENFTEWEAELRENTKNAIEEWLKDYALQDMRRAVIYRKYLKQAENEIDQMESNEDPGEERNEEPGEEPDEESSDDSAEIEDLNAADEDVEEDKSVVVTGE